MKKFLRTFFVLLAVVGGASNVWGATWTVDFTSKAANWSTDQETMIVDNYGSVTINYAIGTINDVNTTAGAMKFSGNAVTLTITLPAGMTFKSGDKIQVTGKGGKSGAPGCVYIADGALKGPQIATKSTDTFDSGEITIPSGFASTNSITLRRATSSETGPDGETNCGGTFYIYKVIYTDGGTVTAKNAAKSGQHAYLDNDGSISDDKKVLSFDNYQMTVEGENIQTGNAQYQFVIGTNNYTGVKYANNKTYIVKPTKGMTITAITAHGSSNDDNNTAGIESGDGNSIELAKRGSKNSPVTVEKTLSLQKNTEGYYFFKITGKQSIIVLDVTYDKTESVNTTISSAGYATLYYDKKLEIPDGIKAYTAELNGSNITLTEVSNVIPANTGVILKATAGKYTLYTTDDDPPAIGTNILLGTTTATTTTDIGGTIYTLGKNSEDVVGLRNYTGTNIRAYSAYAKDLGIAAPFLSFDFGNTTGIEQTRWAAEHATDAIYTLDGQRVSDAKKGLYIKNGRKIIVK